jgi:type I restriction enzyme S subunit
MAWKTLGEVAQYINGRAFKPDEWEDDGLPIIRIQNLTGSTEICNRTTKTYEEKYLVVDGDLLFAWSASLGAHIWHGENGWLNQHIFKIVPYEGTDKQYLYYYLLHVVDQLYAKTHGSGMVHITLKPFKNTAIYMPSLSEQHRIVDRIESLFAKLDEAKEKAQAVVDGFELRKSAILHKAFTGELTERWRRKHDASPNTLLADVEKCSYGWQKKDQQFLKNAQYTAQAVAVSSGHIWIKCTIGAISRVTNGSTPSRKIPAYWQGTIPWVSSGEVRNNIIGSTKECITQGGFDNSSVKLLPTGTVLIAMIGEGKTRGQSAILAIDATINQNIAAVVIDHGLVSSRYIWYWFQMNYARNREKGSGTGPQALNCQRVRELDFFVPSLLEQEEIVCILDEFLMQELQAKEAAEAVLIQIDTMKKAILARAFRGELGTNDPTEGWAGEVVKAVL